MSSQILINALTNYDKIKYESDKYELKILTNYDNKTIDDKVIYQIIKKKDMLKLDLDFEYTHIGLYDKKYKVWIWAWGYSSSKINGLWKWANDGISDINRSREKTEIDVIIMTSFLNSKFILSDQIQLDLIVSLASYFFRSDLIFERNITNNIVEIISIKINKHIN